MGSVPQRCADIDAAFLNAALPTALLGGDTIAAVDVQIIGEGVGFVGELARLTLGYAGGTPPDGALRSLIAKVPTTNPGFKHIGMQLGLYDKEHSFYRHVADRVTLSVPTVFLNHHDTETQEFLLLMEDLGHLRAGNQLESCSLEEAEVVLREIAGFHATWWEHPELDDFAAWLPEPQSPYWLLLEHAYKASVAAVRPTFGYMLSEEVMALCERLAEVYPRGLAAGGLRPPHTFIHGDFRLDNMMFGPNAAFTLLDWQLPFRANPMWDVIYFLSGNFDPEFRRTHQRALVQAYHDALVAGGVASYPFEQCWEDYRATSLVLLGYIGTMAADVDMESFNDRGREVVEMMITRYSLAIEDLGASTFMP